MRSLFPEWLIRLALKLEEKGHPWLVNLIFWLQQFLPGTYGCPNSKRVKRLNLKKQVLGKQIIN